MNVDLSVEFERSLKPPHRGVGGSSLPPARPLAVDAGRDRVPKNGNLLLKVVQLPDGKLGGNQKETLLAVGRWLEINGEAIYSTRP